VGVPSRLRARGPRFLTRGSGRGRRPGRLAPTLSRAGARLTAPRRPRSPAPCAPALPSAALLCAPERAARVEQPVEDRPVALVLHHRRRQRFAQHLALDARDRHAAHGVERFRHRDAHPGGAQGVHEGEDALLHPAMVATHTVRSETIRESQGMNERKVYTVASTTIDSYTSGRAPRRRSTIRKPHALALKRQSVAPTPRYGIEYTRIGLPSSQCQ